MSWALSGILRNELVVSRSNTAHIKNILYSMACMYRSKGARTIHISLLLFSSAFLFPFAFWHFVIILMIIVLFGPLFVESVFQHLNFCTLCTCRNLRSQLAKHNFFFQEKNGLKIWQMIITIKINFELGPMLLLMSSLWRELTCACACRGEQNDK